MQLIGVCSIHCVAYHEYRGVTKLYFYCTDRRDWLIDALHFTNRVGSSINNEHYLKDKMSMTRTLACSWAVWVVQAEFEDTKGAIGIRVYFISLSNTPRNKAQSKLYVPAPSRELDFQPHKWWVFLFYSDFFPDMDWILKHHCLDIFSL